jgi:hypothetical protein
VRISYSAFAESSGDRYVVSIAGETLTGTVQPTGEAYHYETFDLGSLKIAKAGPYVLEIRPAAEYGHNLMYFQSVELAPAVPLMVE